jgi:hypothetical protein
VSKAQLEQRIHALETERELLREIVERSECHCIGKRPLPRGSLRCEYLLQRPV